MKSLTCAILLLISISTLSTVAHGDSDVGSGDPPAPRLAIDKLSVTTSVFTHYLKSRVSAEVANHGTNATAQLVLTVPHNGFVSAASVIVDGQEIKGEIVTHEEAMQRFEDATANGETAGVVQSQQWGPHSSEFVLACGVESGKSATLVVEYEQMLTRRLGYYEDEMRVDMKNQVVRAVSYRSTIYEPLGVTSVISSDPHATVTYTDKHTAVITREWERPTEWPIFPRLKNEGDDSTSDSANDSDDGNDAAVTNDVVDGSEFEGQLPKFFVCPTPRPAPKSTIQFITRYRTLSEEADDEVGKLVFSQPTTDTTTGHTEQYFLHSFRPEIATSMPKRIVFVLDRSGSMSGKKLEQMKAAFRQIVLQLAEADFFNVVIFDSEVETWSTEMVQATEQNRNAAADAIAEIASRGSTNIDGALQAAIDELDAVSDVGMGAGGAAGMIVFFTDGQPTVGDTNPKHICANVRTRVNRRYSVFTLGFGWDLDYTLLRSLAVENDGFDRRILPEDPHAEDQMTKFYGELSTPLLKDITVSYSVPTDIGASVERVSRSQFAYLFKGSEIVVAGKIVLTGAVETVSLAVAVTATGVDGVLSLASIVKPGSNIPNVSGVDFGFPVDDSVKTHNAAQSAVEPQRLWAYLTIHDLMQRVYAEANAANVTVAASDAHKATTATQVLVQSMSLEYGFVSPYTALIIDSQCVSAESVDEGNSGNVAFNGGLRGGGASFAQYTPGPGVYSANTGAHSHAKYARRGGGGHSKKGHKTHHHDHHDHHSHHSHHGHHADGSGSGSGDATGAGSSSNTDANGWTLMDADDMDARLAAQFVIASMTNGIPGTTSSNQVVSVVEARTKFENVKKLKLTIKVTNGGIEFIVEAIVHVKINGDMEIESVTDSTSGTTLLSLSRSITGESETIVALQGTAEGRAGTTAPPEAHRINTATVAGAVGGFIVILAVIVGAVVYHNRSRRSHTEPSEIVVAV
eukprot:GFYU01001069.1.p1 GENE.GFYU01001069.1~~GFYU01001069.1.p1  ORF type:complete len:971 (-),score=343.10 GFYU01001069.1:157-3069(-)